MKSTVEQIRQRFDHDLGQASPNQIQLSYVDRALRGTTMRLCYNQDSLKS